MSDDDDLAAALARAAPRRLWNRGTLVLGALLLVLAGFLGGALTQRQWGTAAAPAANGRPAGGFRGQFAAGQGQPGQGQPGQGQPGQGQPGQSQPGQSAAATAGVTGTVKLIDGRTLYIETTDGRTITVRTDANTAVQRPGALTDVRTGQTVTVQGPADADGTLTATSVTAARK